MYRILCVCNGNLGRSPILSGFIRKRVSEHPLFRIKVESAGMLAETAGLPATELAVACMKERSIDISDHHSRWIGNLDLTAFALIICMNQKIADQVSKLGIPENVRIVVANEENGGVPDPYPTLDMETFQKCVAILERVADETIRDHLHPS